MRRLATLTTALACLLVAAPSSLAASGRPAANSSTFAGYGIQGGGEGTFDVAATFLVPKLKCTSGPDRAIAASVGVYGASGFSAASSFVGCHNGKARYFLSFVLNGVDHNYQTLTPSAGDTVALRVNQSSKSTVVSAQDKTHKGVAKKISGTGNKGGNSPWVGDTAWLNPGVLPVPNFGTLKFSNATLNGTAFGTAGGSATARFDRVNGSTLQIATGSLVNAKSFSTVFKHS